MYSLTQFKSSVINVVLYCQMLLLLLLAGLSTAIIHVLLLLGGGEGGERGYVVNINEHEQ